MNNRTRNAANTTIIGRRTALERQYGRLLRDPNEHPDAAAPAAPEAPEAGAETPPADDGAPHTEEAGSILGDAASPGSGEGEGGEEGAADDANASSGDDATAEAAPFEGLTAPEGFEALDTEALAEATPILRRMGVTTSEEAQERINEFAPVLQGMTTRILDRAAEAQRTAQADLSRQWAEEVRADPEIGGANYDRTVAMSAQAMERFFPGDQGKEFREFLAVTQLGNHPSMIRGFASIGAAISDGSIVIGDSTGSRPAAAHEKLYDPIYQGRQNQ